VRYLVGLDKYRISEICRALSLRPSFVSIDPPLEVQNHSNYKINDKITCNLALELKYGTSVEVVRMDRISNVDFTEVSESRR
jgi:hypothetical protein